MRKTLGSIPGQKVLGSNTNVPGHVASVIESNSTTPTQKKISTLSQRRGGPDTGILSDHRLVDNPVRGFILF